MALSKTLIKTLSYAGMHMAIAILVAYVLSGSWKVAFAIGLVEPCVQTVAYFFHERAWHRAEEKNQTQASGEHTQADYHDSVIDSASPLSRVVDSLLHHKH